MRDERDDAAVATLLQVLPKFRATHEDLFDHFGEACSPQVVFNALAEDVERLLRAGDEHTDALEAYFEAVERVAQLGGIDAIEAVAFSFLDALTLEARRLAPAWFGPATERLALQLDANELGFDELIDGEPIEDELARSESA